MTSQILSSCPTARIYKRPNSQTSSAKFSCCLAVTRILQHGAQTLKSTSQEELQRLRGRCPENRHPQDKLVDTIIFTAMAQQTNKTPPR
ncbi:hypothetical protein F2Q69_00057354 [Brassica cretica]|uniref:Uncharacterized protein n=1 Tax=Brassica cretica TaxID=69181 RepID=A0A8S9MU04_BRACR|nr:hypothetical protein F2Q69_00057354 [Brassica cretica]